MGLAARGIPHRPGGVEAAMRVLAGNNAPVAQAAE
jgi:alanine-glyoxylate transaminase/serine-glyoxylate transaminase/serine-pyruvate transaminase